MDLSNSLKRQAVAISVPGLHCRYPVGTKGVSAAAQFIHDAGSCATTCFALDDFAPNMAQLLTVLDTLCHTDTKVNAISQKASRPRLLA